MNSSEAYKTQADAINAELKSMMLTLSRAMVHMDGSDYYAARRIMRTLSEARMEIKNAR